MLILTRKPGTSILIDLADIDPSTPVGALFAGGPIEIVVTSIKEHQVRLGINANDGFLILRSELVRTARKRSRYSTG